MNKNSLRSSFSKSLMLWFKKEKRKLPFRKTKDPYKVWLSEIILQQTQMETGIKYYKKFIANFPNINFRVIGIIKRKPIKSVANPGMINRTAANAIAAPEINSWAGI